MPQNPAASTSNEVLCPHCRTSYTLMGLRKHLALSHYCSFRQRRAEEGQAQVHPAAVLSASPALSPGGSATRADPASRTGVLGVALPGAGATAEEDSPADADSDADSDPAHAGAHAAAQGAPAQGRVSGGRSVCPALAGVISGVSL
eukprot:scaffold1886_cov617-Prasinococcus_capsulatus_cf.AAC.1